MHFTTLSDQAVLACANSLFSQQYEIYLFQCILLCCKEVVPGKGKDKKDKSRAVAPKTRNKNAKLQLKGRIFMTNVTDVVAMSKTGRSKRMRSVGNLGR
jgi:hypothetical protein